MKVGSLLVFLFFGLPQVGSILQAQMVNRDSLKAIIEKPPNDTADLVALRELGMSFNSDRDSMAYYQWIMLDRALERSDSFWIARSRKSSAS
ncbi:MAG: hypothetical protein AAFN65_03695 [Bacteroidota bacterium]